MKKLLFFFIVISSNLCFCQYYGYNKENNTVSFYSHDTKSNMLIQEQWGGDTVKKNKKNYLQFDEKKIKDLGYMKVEYLGMYIDENCMDEKIDSILIDGKWLAVSDNIQLDYTQGVNDVVFFVGKDTKDQGFFQFDNVGLPKISIKNSKKASLVVDRKVIVKRNCQKLYEGENVNILLSSKNGIIKLDYNKNIHK